MKDWASLLRHLPLRKESQLLVQRFLQDPQGLLFVQIADIFRDHQYDEECIDILSWGVERHPHFTSARVKLAGELFRKGLIQAAWEQLRSSPTPLSQNSSAQKLQFKCAVLLGFESYSRSVYEFMNENDFLDVNLRKLGSFLHKGGFRSAQDVLKEQLLRDGIHLIFDGKTEAAFEVSSATDRYCIKSVTGEMIEISQDPSHFKYRISQADRVFETSRRLSGGYGGKQDDLSLAEIYEAQEQYSQALDIYRIQYQQNPTSEALRNKVMCLAKMVSDQKNIDLSLDPSIVDNLERIDSINESMLLINDLIQEL